MGSTNPPRLGNRGRKNKMATFFTTAAQDEKNIAQRYATARDLSAVRIQLRGCKINAAQRLPAFVAQANTRYSAMVSV